VTMHCCLLWCSSRVVMCVTCAGASGKSCCQLAPAARTRTVEFGEGFKAVVQLSVDQATPSGESPTVTDRLAWTIQHALASITATSFTTAAAFAANLTSSITPVRLFGLFMVALVLINYVLVLTFLLALLVLRERGLPDGAARPQGSCCSAFRAALARARGKGTGWVTLDSAGDAELVQMQPSWQANVPAHNGDERGSPIVAIAEAHGGASLLAAGEPAVADGDAIECQHIHKADAGEAGRDAGVLSQRLDGLRTPTQSRARRRHQRCGCCGCVGAGGTRSSVHSWLGGPYAAALHQARWPVLLLATLATAFFAWRASLLTLPASRPTIWRASSNMRKYNDLEMAFAFGRALERIPISLTWGLRPVDTGSLNSVYEYTDAVLDTAANLTAPASQQWLSALCTELEQWSRNASVPIVAESVKCPMPLVERIAAARNLSIPMPAEVRPALVWWLVLLLHMV
jgi:Patched family